MAQQIATWGSSNAIQQEQTQIWSLSRDGNVPITNVTLSAQRDLDFQQPTSSFHTQVQFTHDNVHRLTQPWMCSLGLILPKGVAKGSWRSKAIGIPPKWSCRVKRKLVFLLGSHIHFTVESRSYSPHQLQQVNSCTHLHYASLCYNPTCQLIPENNPLLSQHGQGAPLSDEHLHQVCWEPFTPLNVAQAHLLEGERKARWRCCW